MIKLLRHKTRQYWKVIEYNSNGSIRNAKIFDADKRKDAVKYYKKLKRNAYNREKNQILKDLCGTSARQAKIDMGL
jgi:hypothetical protein